MNWKMRIMNWLGLRDWRTDGILTQGYIGDVWVTVTEYKCYKTHKIHSISKISSEPSFVERDKLMRLSGLTKVKPLILVTKKDIASYEKVRKSIREKGSYQTVLNDLERKVH